MFYRFELIFDGVDQDVGIFQGIADTGIEEHQRYDLMAHFDEVLPIPQFLNDKMQTHSYFTENGLTVFYDSLRLLINAIEYTRIWSVKKIKVKTLPGKVLYKDFYQVVCEK